MAIETPDELTPRRLMEAAIEAATHCNPSDLRRTPRVGAVIENEGQIIATGHRGPDDHAEKHAIDQVADKDQLIGATVYTTLEPCTGSVRRRPQEACTSLLTQYKVRKVYIGILDPNQEVCGKGVLALQKHKIEVALFDPDLADRIMTLNAEFIRAQQSLGAEFIYPAGEERIITYTKNGNHEFTCTTINPPGDDIYVVVEAGGIWWPQPGRLQRVESSNRYRFIANFWAYGPHTVHIVRVNELGSALITYFRRVESQNQTRRVRLQKQFGELDERLFGGHRIGIALSKAPRGFDVEASIDVRIEEPPKNDAGARAAS